MGQHFLFDVELEVGRAGRPDRIEDDGRLPMSSPAWPRGLRFAPRVPRCSEALACRGRRTSCSRRFPAAGVASACACPQAAMLEPRRRSVAAVRVTRPVTARATSASARTSGDREATICVRRSQQLPERSSPSSDSACETDPVGVTRPAAVPERRRRARDRALRPRAARSPARGRSRRLGSASAASAGARARSTSTCCSTATRRSTSRA